MEAAIAASSHPLYKERYRQRPRRSTSPDWLTRGHGPV
jgi:hypothetical protein